MPFPVVLPVPAGRRAARRLGPLPGRDRRHVRARSRFPRPTRAPAPGGSRSCCGRRSGRHPRTPAQRSATSLLRHIYRHADAIATYGPHVSRLRPHQAPDGPGVRGAPGRRRRVLGSAGARPSATATSRSCSPAGPRPRRASTCSQRAADIGTLVVAERPHAPTRSAQPLRGQRRCGRTVGSHARLSSSRGGSSSTKPSTREFP